MVAGFKLCYIAGAQTGLVWEEPGSVFTSGGMVGDKTSHSGADGVWSSYGVKPASPFAVCWGDKVVIIVVGV